MVPVVSVKEVPVPRDLTEAEWDTVMTFALNSVYAQYQVDSTKMFSKRPLQELLTWRAQKVTDRGDSIDVTFRLPRASFDIRVKAADIYRWRVDTVKVTLPVKLTWKERIFDWVIGVVIGILLMVILRMVFR